MASPKEVNIFLVDASGDPLTGQVGLLSFSQYKGTDASTPTPPSFIDRGDGNYAFLPVFTDADVGYYYTIDTGSGAYPSCIGGYTRPEDFYVDTIQADVQRIKVTGGGEGKRQAFLTGPHANQEVLYDTDGTTILQVFNLYNALGVQSAADDVFIRIPRLVIP